MRRLFLILLLIVKRPLGVGVRRRADAALHGHEEAVAFHDVNVLRGGRDFDLHGAGIVRAVGGDFVGAAGAAGGATGEERGDGGESETEDVFHAAVCKDALARFVNW